MAARAGAGRGVGRHALRGAAPARRPARPRRDGRDARDRHDLVEPRRAALRGHARARGLADAPRSCSATPRTSTRPAPRSTSPRSPPRTATTRRASGSGRRRRRWTRSSARAARSATTTRSAPTTRRGCRPRPGALGHDVLRVLKERCDPAGIMNPGKLLAELAALQGAAERASCRACSGCCPCSCVRQDLAVAPRRPSRKVDVLLARALDLEQRRPWPTAGVSPIRFALPPGPREPQRVASSPFGVCRHLLHLHLRTAAAAGPGGRARTRRSPCWPRRCP